MSLYPIFVDLTDRICLVAGLGAVGRRKMEGLIAAGPKLIRLVDPTPPHTDEQRLAAHPADALAAVFERHGLPFAPILRPEQLFDDPHLNATGGLAEITLPDGERAGGTARTTLMPLRLDGQRMGVRLDPPRLGQHNARVAKAAE